VTLHRNENLSLLEDWLTEIDKIAQKNSRYNFIYPVHPNPTITKIAAQLNHVKLTPPLEHCEFIKILKNCSAVISDSGGVQEEGSFLGKKDIVCRKTTERPEGIATGHLIMCATPPDLPKIFERVIKSVTINAPSPYGDGKAANKINTILTSYE